MGLQVSFAPYLLVFFFCYSKYLFRETKTNKVDKKKIEGVRLTEVSLYFFNRHRC